MGDSAVLVAKVSPRWGRRLPQRGRLGQDGAMRDLNDLTRPTVPSGAIQERMLARLRSAAALARHRLGTGFA